MRNIRSHGNPLLPLNPNSEILLYLNHTMIELVRTVNLEGVWDKPYAVPSPSLGDLPNINDR